MDFTNKVVIITGGSSGMGAAAAKLFAEHGATLSLIGRSVDRLNQVANACEAFKGNRPLIVAVDLTNEGSCEEVVAKTVDKFKRIDVLINSAGKATVSSLFDDSMEVFDELMTLNLRAPYRLTQLCVPHLIKTKGNIVNILCASSRSRPGLLPYFMMREAMLQFTKAGAIELLSVGVRMNTIRPGITRTNFIANFNIEQDNMDTAYDNLVLDSVATTVIEPEEVARMILFAASDVCPNLNAAELTIDGAYSSF